MLVLFICEVNKFNCYCYYCRDPTRCGPENVETNSIFVDVEFEDVGPYGTRTHTLLTIKNGNENEKEKNLCFIENSLSDETGKWEQTKHHFVV